MQLSLPKHLDYGQYRPFHKYLDKACGIQFTKFDLEYKILFIGMSWCEAMCMGLPSGDSKVHKSKYVLLLQLSTGHAPAVIPVSHVPMSVDIDGKL